MAVYANNSPGSSPAGGFESWKGSFFDAEPVLAAMDKATRKALSKFGAYVRRRAQTSLRYGVQPSEPGQPPTAHKSGMRRKVNKRTGTATIQAVSPLREFIFFAYDADRQSVVIGPALTNQSAKLAGAGGRPEPDLLEHGGGTVPVVEYLNRFKGGEQKWLRTPPVYRLGRTPPANVPTRKRSARIDARPYMQPALVAELPGLPAMFANAF